MTTAAISIASNGRMMSKDASKIKDFTITPKIIEDHTNPSLYSFFKGLRNVVSRSGVERRSNVYLKTSSDFLKA
jgi:hypothetical protein